MAFLGVLYAVGMTAVAISFAVYSYDLFWKLERAKKDSFKAVRERVTDEVARQRKHVELAQACHDLRPIEMDEVCKIVRSSAMECDGKFYHYDWLRAIDDVKGRRQGDKAF